MRSILIASASITLSAAAVHADVFTTSVPETYRFVVNAPYTPTPSQTAITTEHTDLGFAFNGAWDLYWHQEESDVEYEPGAAYVNAQNVPATPRPTGSQWDFIGTPAGSSFYALPQSQQSGLPYLGFSTEESDAGILRAWDPDGAGPRGNSLWTRVNVLSVTNANGNAAAGNFSIYTFNGVGQVVPLAATFDGLNSADAVYLEGLSHSHFNLAFSAPGIYDVTFASTTFAAVPEPTSLSVLGLGAIALLRRNRA